MKKFVSILGSLSLTMASSSLLVSCKWNNDVTNPRDASNNNNNCGSEGNRSRNNVNLERTTSFWVLSVGNANFTFLQNQDHAVIFDVGVGMSGQVNEGVSDDGLDHYSSKASETGNWKMDSTDRTKWVVDYMKNVAHVNYIDAILISHKHQDHFSGLKAIVNNFDVGTVVAPMDSLGLETTIHALSNGKNIKVDTNFDRNYQFMGVDIENISAYASQENLDEACGDNPNSTSAIWRFAVNNKTFLLPGDMQDHDNWKTNLKTNKTPIMSDLTVQNKIKEKPVDVYLPSHHGSANSSQSITFALGALQIKPEEVIISGTTATEYWKGYANALVFPDERPTSELGKKNQTEDPNRGKVIYNIKQSFGDVTGLVKLTGVAPKSVTSVAEYNNIMDYDHQNYTFEYRLTTNNTSENKMIYHNANIVNKYLV
ncbi:MBL fold metallo-hydrolase [Mesoplasma melaleucae]|uniref:Metallo-beta-lactamase domain-containing protein n=1 Tax=Mesoplasma melaleucae TaxID=81459 RepID=A0A2K8NXZ2_9MOLU|nr:MBL fold metallo-hydrolase [Mesoplasma melaleucae]ATZ17621.1 hypothetical protein EMELA_v1c00290 [Mesoplasma melaleucae]